MGISGLGGSDERCRLHSERSDEAHGHLAVLRASGEADPARPAFEIDVDVLDESVHPVRGDPFGNPEALSALPPQPQPDHEADHCGDGHEEQHHGFAGGFPGK